MSAISPILAPDRIVASGRASWQDRAVAAYRKADPRRELAARVLLLTDRTIPLDAIFVNPTDGTATASLDDVVFRLRRDTLMVVRSCAYCGVQQFESPPINSPADLGYALDAWQPYCEECAPEDPPDWASW